MFEFSARNVGERQAVGLDVELPRYRQERLAAEEILREIHLPCGVRDRLARSDVDTRNNAPAPSASDEVMIGLLTQKYLRSSRNRRIACVGVRRVCSG